MFKLTNFADPMSPLNAKAKSILVLKTMRDGYKASDHDRFTDVQRCDNNWQGSWYVGEDGNYALGIPMNPAYYDFAGSYIIAIDEEGHATLGLASRGDEAEGTMGYRQVRRQDGKELPASLETQQLVTKKWFAAAPWATEYFPDATDTPTTAALREEMLELTIKRRRLHVELHSEALRRHWIDTLDDLDDEYKLPTPQYSAKVDATVLVRTNSMASLADIPDGMRDDLDRMGRGNAASFNYVPQNVAFTTGHNSLGVRNTLDAIRSINNRDLKELLSAYMTSNSSYMIGDSIIKPMLHSIEFNY